MIDKKMFDENWKLVRSQATARWSLMAEFDLNKVDKAEVKFDKFVSLLQVKYGYPRPQAAQDLNRFCLECIAKSKLNA
jgi:hypothetical protein